MRGARFLFFKFVHNALIHPLLALPWEPRWAQRLRPAPDIRGF